MCKIGIGMLFFGIKNGYRYVILFPKSVSVRLKFSKSAGIGIGKIQFKENRSIPNVNGVIPRTLIF